MKKSSPQTTAKRQTTQKIRYAVVALGNIAQVAVLPGFKAARKNSELVALVSSDDKKLKALGKRYGVKTLVHYDQYDELLASGLIDAVYITLPNSMHADFAIRAAKAGIHVLCEKPLSVTQSESIKMTKACEKAGVKLMTAYRLHFDPANLDTIKQIRAGKIGTPRYFSAIFSQELRQGDIRSDKALGGGAVSDMGIYCINAARMCFGSDPYEVFAYSVKGTDSRFEEVEEMTNVLMRFPNECLASFTTSMGAVSVGRFDLVGTKGTIRLDPAFGYGQPTKREMKIGERTQEKIFPMHDQFAAELKYFSDCVLRNKPIEPNGSEGEVDVAIIQAIYKSAKTGKPVKVSAQKEGVRPQVKQKIALPPHAEVKDLVNAPGPSVN